MDASIGRTTRPSFASLSRALSFSAVITSMTVFSTSPSGPGTSIGRTTSPPLCLDCSILIRSPALISFNTDTARASASPRGPLFASSTSLGRILPLFQRSFSAFLMESTKFTAWLSRSARGPPSPSIGRTSSPSESAIFSARFPSSSMTLESHLTSLFSARPSGPIFSSAASIGRTYEGSSPIILARLSSTIRSASFCLNNEDLHL
mmetsp:Transcript_62855/g.185635  ORF Transcript_62855/g.185635 Transcript_62855/m.185635 type:complete len:206 (+) Transcript_62855:582-1199(+)